MNPFYKPSKNNRIPIESLKSSIIEDILIERRLNNGDRLPSLRELTESLSTNHVTLTKAIKELTNFGILKTYEKKGIFVENLSKCSDLLIKNPIVGAILPYSDRANGYYFDEIAAIIEAKLKTNDIRLIVQNIKWKGGDVGTYIDDFSKYYKTGALILRLPEDYSDFTAIKKALLRGVNIVLIDSSLPVIPLSTILVDNFKGGKIAALHLLERGHKKIGFLRNSLSDSPTASKIESDRFEGFVSTLKNNGASFPENFDIRHSFSDTTLIDHIKVNGITAIFAYNDENGYNLVNYLQRNDLKVPQDISVIGFDNIAMYPHCRLTSIDPDRKTMAETAAEWIYSNNQDRKLLIKPKLIPGDTVEDIRA